jgi:hypothetical protein
MKRVIWNFFGILVSVMAVSLSGCLITGASPDPSSIVTMKYGETSTFEVSGPSAPAAEERIKSPSLRYAWYVNNMHRINNDADWEFSDFFIKEGETFSYKALPGDLPLVNRTTIICAIEQGYPLPETSQSGRLSWEWREIDRRQWDVRISQDSPVWQGDYLIRDSSDLQDIKRYFSIDGNLFIQGSGFSNLEGIPSGLRVSGSVVIMDNPNLLNLRGLENITSGRELFINGASSKNSGTRMIIYNDLKEQDILGNPGLVQGRRFIVNNFLPSPELIAILNQYTQEWWLALHMHDGSVEDALGYIQANNIKKVAVDAENYNLQLAYSKELGEEIRNKLTLAGVDEIILLPEDLGGDKYKGYKDFILGLNPSKVLMERTYQQPEPWNIFTLLLRNIYLRPREIYIGIWPEAVSPFWRPIQLYAAKLFSGNKVFWYSETKAMPFE